MRTSKPNREFKGMHNQMITELNNIIWVLWRWKWLIVSVVLVTGLALGARVRTAEPVYAAQVKLQLTAPQQEDVALDNRYRYVALREEMTVIRNNLMEVLQAREVYERTISRLALADEDATYTLDASSIRDTDFIFVTVKARTAELAADIANAHVDAAVAYFGELRAKPVDAARNLIAGQLHLAEEQYHAAKNALTEFQARNGITTSLEDELATYQKLLEQLQLEHDRQLLKEYISWVDPTADVNELIAQRREELQRLMALRPQHDQLEEDAQQTHAKYQYLLDKYSEANLKVDSAQAVTFIQIVEPAELPLRPVDNAKRLLILAMAGSLGLGMLLAFFLEYASDTDQGGGKGPVDSRSESPPELLSPTIVLDGSKTGPSVGRQEKANNLD
jgi:uncharacterized protein involved in exopolysaccharide biosynthesis